MEKKKLKDAIKIFEKKIKKQGRITNARDVEHLKNLKVILKNYDKPSERKPTIAEIKRTTKKEAPYFFDAKTMKDFGQRMSDYKVHQCKDGKVYIYAKSYATDYRTGKKEFMGYTIRQWTGSDLKNTNRKLIEITNC